MYIQKKLRYICLTTLFVIFSATSAEAQIWGQLKNVVEIIKAEEVVTKTNENAGEDKTEKSELSKSKNTTQVHSEKIAQLVSTKKLKQPTGKSNEKSSSPKPIVNSVENISNNKSTKNSKEKIPYPQDFPLPTDEAYREYISQQRSSTDRFPKCFAILQWATKTYRLDKNTNVRNFWGGKFGGKYLMSGHCCPIKKNKKGSVSPN